MTKMRDNFSNPNPFLSQVKNYQDLVNQPHWAEPLADSFKQSASQPAKGPQQRMANAMMGGFASGIQGAVNKERQDRLSPILEQAGQITAKAAELEAQSQQERQRIFTGTKYVRDNITRLMALGEGSMARDEIGTQGVARELGRDYQKAFGLNLGEFDHYDVNSRRIFYAKDGVVTGYSIPDTLREYATEAFGEQAPYVMRTLDPYSKNIWENTQAMEQAKLAKEQSSAKMNNAHADLFKAETDSEKAKLSAPPPKYDDKTQSHIRTDNTNWINELYKKHKDAKVAIDAQVAMRDAIQQEVKNGSWGTGSSTFAAVSRWAKAATNQNKAQQLIELKRQPLFKDLKNTFGSRVTDNDLATWLTTQVDLSNDPQLGIQILNERIQEAQKDINEELTRRRILETEFNNNEPYNSLLVDERVQKELKNSIANQNPDSTSDNNMVQVVSPSGQIGMIPQASLQSAIQKGFKVQE